MRVMLTYFAFRKNCFAFFVYIGAKIKSVSCGITAEDSHNILTHSVFPFNNKSFTFHITRNTVLNGNKTFDKFDGLLIVTA